MHITNNKRPLLFKTINTTKAASLLSSPWKFSSLQGRWKFQEYETKSSTRDMVETVAPGCTTDPKDVVFACKNSLDSFSIRTEAGAALDGGNFIARAGLFKNQEHLMECIEWESISRQTRGGHRRTNYYYLTYNTQHDTFHFKQWLRAESTVAMKITNGGNTLRYTTDDGSVLIYTRITNYL